MVTGNIKTKNQEISILPDRTFALNILLLEKIYIMGDFGDERV